MSKSVEEFFVLKDGCFKGVEFEDIKVGDVWIYRKYSGRQAEYESPYYQMSSIDADTEARWYVELDARNRFRKED